MTAGFVYLFRDVVIFALGALFALVIMGRVLRLVRRLSVPLDGDIGSTGHRKPIRAVQAAGATLMPCVRMRRGGELRRTFYSGDWCDRELNH
jgi:hypothetical protein